MEFEITLSAVILIVAILGVVVWGIFNKISSNEKVIQERGRTALAEDKFNGLVNQHQTLANQYQNLLKQAETIQSEYVIAKELLTPKALKEFGKRSKL